MKFKSMIAVLAISMAVLMIACGTGADSSSAPEATPVASATPAPTETPAPTDEPGTLEFDFDISVETYKVTQGVTEEELLADQAKKEGMFEWFYDGAVNYAQALLDKDNGCENVFLDEYIQWAGDKALAENPEAVPTPKPESPNKGVVSVENTPDGGRIETYEDGGRVAYDKDGNLLWMDSNSDNGLSGQELEESIENGYEMADDMVDFIESGKADEIIQKAHDRLEAEGHSYS